MEWLERRGPSRLDRYYDMGLDYFYWIGAQRAMVGASEAFRRKPAP
jgi:hypothetical protein